MLLQTKMASYLVQLYVSTGITMSPLLLLKGCDRDNKRKSVACDSVLTGSLLITCSIFDLAYGSAIGSVR